MDKQMLNFWVEEGWLESTVTSVFDALYEPGWWGDEEDGLNRVDDDSLAYQPWANGLYSY